MAKQDFVSKTDDGKVLQLVNFVNKIPLYKALLGITDDQVTSITNDKNMFAYAVSLRETYKTKVQDVTSWKDILRDGPLGTPPGPIPPPPPAAGGLVLVAEGIVGRFRDLARQIKNHPSYSNSIGEDLGIVGDEKTVDIPNSQPKMTARKVETGWELSFSLLNFFDGVKIFRTRPGGTKTFIAVDTSSPYIDTEPMVSGTAYTAFFLIGDDTVGLESNPVVISI